METALRFLAFVLLCGAPALAAEKPSLSPSEVAQSFYDSYMEVLRANGDTNTFVLGSKAFTRSFKKAYRKLIADGMESDPIICAQDFPSEGYAASPAKIDGGKAVVTMKSRSRDMPVSFQVTLREIDGRWLISDTNDLKADAGD